MNDLISRQAAIDAICQHGTDLERKGITVLAVANHKQVTVDLLEKLPSAERRGRWGYFPTGNYKCSMCGAWYSVDDDEPLGFDYCPNCGASMVDEEVEEFED